MKISEISLTELKEYIHVYHEEDDKLISAILTASKAFVKNYTGLSPERLDISEDLAMAVFIIGADLYDNRMYAVDDDTVNPVIKALLEMHSVNLL